MTLRTADGGWYEWAEWADPRQDSRLFVQVGEADDGRYHVTALRVEGKVSAEVLRSIPVGRLEAAANALLHGDAADGGPRGAARERRGKPRARIADSLRANAVQGYPDTFYDAVAAVYRGLVAASSRPIAELAEANDVPVTTAQRWVKEARRRGKLPPGRPGKSG